MAGRIVVPGAHAHRSITRRKGLFRTFAQFPECHVEHNGFGQPCLVGPDGLDPLRHPDPVTRLLFAYGASRWGVLGNTLILAAQGLDRIPHPDHLIREIRSLAVHELLNTSPPAAEYRAALERRDQLEFDLEAEGLAS